MQQSEIRNPKSEINLTPTELTKRSLQSAYPQVISIMADLHEAAKDGAYKRGYTDLKGAAADMLLEKGFDVEWSEDKQLWEVGFGEQEDLHALIKEVFDEENAKAAA